MTNLAVLNDRQLNDYYAIWTQTWAWLLINRPRWKGKIKTARKHADAAMVEYRRRNQDQQAVLFSTTRLSSP